MKKSQSFYMNMYIYDGGDFTYELRKLTRFIGF